MPNPTPAPNPPRPALNAWVVELAISALCVVGLVAFYLADLSGVRFFIFLYLWIGAVAGWLAGKIVQGTGFGLLMNIVTGIVGVFTINWLLPDLGVPLRDFYAWTGHYWIGLVFVSMVIVSTIGTVILLIVVRRIKRAPSA